MPKYEVVPKGGRVLDPANGIDSTRDIGIATRRVEAEEQELQTSQRADNLDVRGKGV